MNSISNTNREMHAIRTLLLNDHLYCFITFALLLSIIIFQIIIKIFMNTKL